MICHKTPILNTVSRKYGLGYLLLAGVAAALIALSSVIYLHFENRYDEMTDELLELNNLYIGIESLNNTVNDGYLYLKSDNFSQYETQCRQIEQVIQKLNGYEHTRSSREMIDTICTAETYMEQTDALMKLLRSYAGTSGKLSANLADTMEGKLSEKTSGGMSDKLSDKSSEIYGQILASYHGAEETMTYITQSFQQAYTAKLAQTREIQKNLAADRRRFMALQLLAACVGSAVCALYFAKVIRSVTKSIHTLTGRVKEIEADVYSGGHVQMNSGDEFDSFANALNQMIDVIRTQLRKLEENVNIRERLAATEIENLRMYSELQKSRLKLLQSRINPHFLFNTLNMISSQARLEQADSAAGMLEITASYLRYHLDNLNKAVTLKKEIANLKDYVNIQKYRFEDRYDYEFEVDRECEAFIMPPMILQPLVENSIKHGLNMTLLGGRVMVGVRMEAGRVLLKVEDNGCGMSQEQLDTLMEHIKQCGPESEHIGLRNIYMRLGYFYEGDVTFTMSCANHKTTVLISLPYKELT